MVIQMSAGRPRQKIRAGDREEDRVTSRHSSIRKWSGGLRKSIASMLPTHCYMKSECAMNKYTQDMLQVMFEWVQIS